MSSSFDIKIIYRSLSKYLMSSEISLIYQGLDINKSELEIFMAVLCTIFNVRVVFRY